MGSQCCRGQGPQSHSGHNYHNELRSWSANWNAWACSDLWPWLTPHGVPRTALDVQSLKALLDMDKQENSGSSGKNHGGELEFIQCWGPEAQNSWSWGWEWKEVSAST